MHEPLASEKVIISAPLSYVGSTQRIIRLRQGKDGGVLVAVTIAVILLLLFAWAFITIWYLFWGIFLIPYRLLRRGSRKRKREALQHRELLTAISAQQHDDGAITTLERAGAQPELPAAVDPAKPWHAQPTVRDALEARKQRKAESLND